MLQIPRRASGAPRVYADTNIAVGHPLFRVDDFPALVEIGRAGGHVWMLRSHALPCGRITILKSQALSIRTAAQDDRIGALTDRTEYIRAEHIAVIHLDRD